MADIRDSNWHEQDDANVEPSPLGLPANSPADAVYEIVRAHQGAITRWYNRSNPTYTSAGTGAAYTLNFLVSPGTYKKSDCVTFFIHAANAGAATVNVNGIGARSILRNDGSPLVAGDLAAN